MIGPQRHNSFCGNRIPLSHSLHLPIPSITSVTPFRSGNTDFKYQLDNFLTDDSLSIMQIDLASYGILIVLPPELLCIIKVHENHTVVLIPTFHGSFRPT